MNIDPDIPTLTKNQKRFLRGYECGWCTQYLDRSFCGAIWDTCRAETRMRRRAECLAQCYKPRRRPQLSTRKPKR